MENDRTLTAKTSRETERLLDEHRAARYLGLSVKTLRNWRSAKRGPRYVKISRIVRYRIRDLDQFIETNVVETGT